MNDTVKIVGPNDKRVDTKTIDAKNNNVVIVNHVTKHKNDNCYQLRWKFDFDGLSREELMIIAARALVIDARPQFKKSDRTKIHEWNNITFNVKNDMLNRKRVRKPVKDKVAQLSAQLTIDEREALIKQLQAMQNGN